MKSRYFLPFFGMFALFQIASCGGGDSDTVILAITPAGPTAVTRDDTLALSANLEVTWSVAGGNSRGTIDADGLYTPPSSIPVDSPVVTILAQSFDGQDAEAFIDLRAANTLTLSTPEPVSDTGIPFSLLAANIFLGPQANRMSLRSGSLQVDSVWPNDEANPTIFFSQNTDFGGFLPELDITPGNTDIMPLSIETDVDKNPVLTAIDSSSGENRLQFLRSNDEGESFDAPVDVSPANPLNSQSAGNLALDDLGDLHVIYQETDTSVINGPTNIFYSKSVNGGLNWSAPTPITNAVDNTNPNVFPYLVVSPDGEKIVLCWNQTSPEEILSSQSQNGGNSFSAPSPVTNDGDNQFCRLAYGPNDAVYLTYSHQTGSDDSDALVRKSLDGGVSFENPSTINTSSINVNSTLIFLAVDDLGRVDVAFTGDPSNSGETDTILHARSLDNGASYVEQTPLFEASAAMQLGVPNGLRHDVASRLHLQYLQINGSTDYQVFYRYGQ